MMTSPVRDDPQDAHGRPGSSCRGVALPPNAALSTRLATVALVRGRLFGTLDVDAWGMLVDIWPAATEAGGLKLT